MLSFCASPFLALSRRRLACTPRRHVRDVLRIVLLGCAAGAGTVFAATTARPTVPTDRPVNYEAFGAIGDGVADDLPAIVEAHAFANVHGLPVKSKPGATYHLGRRALTAIIATDTDWGTSRFVIDDTDVENHRIAVQRTLAPRAGDPVDPAAVP
jgi:hypothetical protein